MCLGKLLIKQKKAMTACSFNLYCLLVIYFTVYGKITLVRTRTILFVGDLSQEIFLMFLNYLLRYFN